MAAISHSDTRSSGCLTILLAAALVGIIALIAVPALNQHAAQRHGSHAISAIKYARRYTPEPQDDDRYWTGTDANGRDYTIIRLEELPGKPVTWVVIIVAGGVLVTAFLAQSGRTIDRIKDKCN